MTLSVRAATSLLVAVSLVQFAASYSFGVVEVARDIPHLGRIPAIVGKWQLTGEQRLEPIVAEYLRPDDYVLRDYQAPGSAPVNLFAAYFRSLQNTYGPHSPKVCLPGSGWLVKASATVRLKVGAVSLPVNRYVLQKNRQTILVLYWYQNDRRVWAEEVQAKLFLLHDLLRYRRSDVTLVRIVTPVPSETSTTLDEHLAHPAIAFVQALYPLLVDRHMTVQ